MCLIGHGMNAQTPTKLRKSGLLKARCEVELENTFEREAARLGVDTSDLVRAALREFAPRLNSVALWPTLTR